MPTRRQLLRSSVGLALTGGLTSSAERETHQIERTYWLPTLTSGDHLTEESEQGFRSLLPDGFFARNDLPRLTVGKETVIVLAGVRSLSWEFVRKLRGHMEDGAWVIWERAANFSGQSKSNGRELLAVFFGVWTGVCTDVGIDACSLDAMRMHSSWLAAGPSYVEYGWPMVRSVRGFHDAACVQCRRSEMIAEYRGRPIAMRRSIGKGGIVFLGTMLGPGIRAGEREAQEIGRSILEQSATAVQEGATTRLG